jgi:hypothetical protein
VARVAPEISEIGEKGKACVLGEEKFRAVINQKQNSWNLKFSGKAEARA